MKKRKLTRAETVSVASMLFGLFFGAGNLIFPAYMGQAAGLKQRRPAGGRRLALNVFPYMYSIGRMPLRLHRFAVSG